MPGCKGLLYLKDLGPPCGASNTCAWSIAAKKIGILKRLSLTIHSASAQETSIMDPRAPAGQQMSSQPLSGDWSSGPVQTQQRLDRPTQQATQAISGT